MEHQNEACPVAITGGNSQIAAKVTDIAKRLGHTKSMAAGFLSSYKNTKSVQEYMLRNTGLGSNDAEMPALTEIVQALCSDNAPNNAAVRAFVQPQVARPSRKDEG
ncbi:hypothetical protein K438DRAFT_1768702 [Mycena galopus ATCC 62051]|nr:hypothetical protein K438DRAFT_1768702 [Mycena galopus ATCC 62051]